MFLIIIYCAGSGKAMPAHVLRAMPQPQKERDACFFLSPSSLFVCVFFKNLIVI